MTLTGTLLVACIAAAAPAEPRPAIEIATDFIEITVEISPAIDEWPALAADLRAEAREFAAGWLAWREAEVSATTEQEQRHEFASIYEVQAVISDRYVSVLVHSYLFTGGAHGNSGSRAILWDLAHQRRADARSFFAETAEGGPTMTALARLVRGAIVREKLRRGSTELGASATEGSPPSLDELIEQDRRLANVQANLEGAGLEASDQPGKSSGLTFHFWSCQVDSCAAGGLAAFVPWRDLAPFLSAEGASIFGGERAASSENE